MQQQPRQTIVRNWSIRGASNGYVYVQGQFGDIYQIVPGAPLPGLGPVESIRRIEVSVRPSEAPEKSSLAYVTGFYGTAIAPPGVTQISWRGSQQQGGGGQPGERRRDSETEPPPQQQPEPGEPVNPEPEPGGEDPSS